MPWPEATPVGFFLNWQNSAPTATWKLIVVLRKTKILKKFQTLRKNTVDGDYEGSVLMEG